MATPRKHPQDRIEHGVQLLAHILRKKSKYKVTVLLQQLILPPITTIRDRIREVLFAIEFDDNARGAQQVDFKGCVTRVERHEIIENWTRIKSEWILIRNDSVQRFEYCVRIYSGQELVDLLRDVGFVDVVLYGGLDGRPYGPGARRLIAVARKA